MQFYYPKAAAVKMYTVKENITSRDFPPPFPYFFFIFSRWSNLHVCASSVREGSLRIPDEYVSSRVTLNYTQQYQDRRRTAIFPQPHISHPPPFQSYHRLVQILHPWSTLSLSSFCRNDSTDVKLLGTEVRLCSCRHRGNCTRDPSTMVRGRSDRGKTRNKTQRRNQGRLKAHSDNILEVNQE